MTKNLITRKHSFLFSLIFLMLLLSLFLDKYCNSNVIMAFDPITLSITAGAGILGAASSLFKKKRQHISLNDLLANGYQEMDPDKIKADNERQVNREITNIRNSIARKNASMGLITPTNYASESPLWDKLNVMNSGVDEKARQEKNAIAKYLFQANQQIDNYNDGQPDALDGLLNAGLLGGSLAASFKMKNNGGDITVDDLKETNLITNYLNSKDMNLDSILSGGMPDNGYPQDGQLIPTRQNGLDGYPQMNNMNPGMQQNVIAGIPVNILFQMQPQDLIGIIQMLDMKLKSLFTDSVPTMLSPGEKVMNKEAAAMGGPLLDNLNIQGLNQRNFSNVQFKNAYSYDELLQMKQSNPDAYNYILEQIQQNKIQITE